MPAEASGKRLPESIAAPLPRFDVKLSSLHLWRDSAFRTAPSNMALDEAVFRWTLEGGKAAARFYQWDRPARTRGYFQRDAEAGEAAQKTVRRYTGGGLVEHGEDLTFVLALPSGSPPASLDAGERYRWIHEALGVALAAAGCALVLESDTHQARPGPCFNHPVPWDLIDPATGQKLGGGAQRRSRGAVIHQGSVRLPVSLRHPDSDWIDDFLSRLAETHLPIEEDERHKIETFAEDLAETRYLNATWNRGPEGNAGKEV